MSAARARRAALAIAATAYMIAPCVANAQDTLQEGTPGRLDEISDQIRTRIELIDVDRRRPPSLVLHRSSSGRGWRVTLREPDKTEIMSLRLPSWVGEPYYDYTVRVASSSRRDARYVVFEAIPSESRNAPPEASTIQIAWLVTSPRRGQYRWRLITQASSSALDGGALLTLKQRESGAKAPTYDLIREREDIGQQFCGAQARDVLQQEIFSPDKALFLIQLKLEELAKDAPSLTAYLPNRPFEPSPLLNYARWRAATSDLRTPTDSTTVLRPLELGDRDLSTVWAEGAPDVGRGEFASARIEASLPIKGFRVFPSSGESAERWAAWQRPKKLLVGLANGTRFVVDLPDLPYADLARQGGMVVTFPEAVTSDCLSVLILDAWPAAAPRPKKSAFRRPREYTQALAEHSATAIGEITPISSLHGLSRPIAANQILDVLYSLEREPDRQALALATRPYGAALIEALRARLSRPNGLENLDRAASLLSQFPADEALPLLMELLDRVDASDPAYGALKRAVAAHREEAAAPLQEELEALPEGEERKRIDLIRLYGRVALPAQLSALMRDLGKGNSRVRNERARAITAGGMEIFGPLLAFAVEHAGQPGGLDALRALDAISRRQRVMRVEISPVQRDQMLELARLYADDQRALMRVILLLGQFYDPAHEALLSTFVMSHPSPLVRQRAAEALDTHASATSLDALKAALGDPSPDVRIEAIRAISERSDREQALSEVMAYVERERWPEGLEPALRYLVSLDRDTIDEDLNQQLTDPLVPYERAYEIAQAYERSKRGLSNEAIDALFVRDHLPYDLRRQLIETMAYGEPEPRVERLIALLEDERIKRQYTPRQHEELLKRALLSLGRHRSEAGKRRLLQVVREEPTMSLRLAALRGLSFYGDKDLQEELAQMRPQFSDERLLEALDSAISSIDRRADLREVQELVEEQAQEERIKKRQAVEESESGD